MSFVLAVAVGTEAADDLERACGDLSGVASVRHREQMVAWSTTSPWAHVHDDGDILVALDGVLHDGVGPTASSPAERMHARYLQHGVDVARGLLGDFILIVLDRNRRRLLVARDPVGVRPWHQSTSGQRHTGATDVATLARLPWVDTRLDEKIAIEYLAGVAQSRGPTLHQGIRTLAPGHTWSAEGGGEGVRSHHEWVVAPERDLSWDDGVQRCRELLDLVVACRVPSGQPATCELSGGLDSSAVVGTVVRLGLPDALAGRLLFDSPGADERGFSDAVAAHLGVELLSAPPWLPSREEFDDLTRRLRRPPPDPNFTMFLSLHRALSRRGRSHTLTGLGGDDAFVAMSAGARVVSAIQLRQRTVLRDLARAARRDPRQAWREWGRPALRQVTGRGSARPPHWVTPEAAEKADLPALFKRQTPHLTGSAATDERLNGMTSGYNAAILNDRAVIVDLVNRRESHPYLDPRLVAGTYGLDPWWPVRGGHYRALQAGAYADRLPPLVAQRRSKAEFSGVVWPQMLTDEAVTAVQAGPLHTLGWLSASGFVTVVGQAKEGRANAAVPLLRCVALDRWLRSTY